MSRHDDNVRLRHMLDHAREAVAMCSGKSRGSLAQERMLYLALVRLIEIVGEAAARVSPEGRGRVQIAWQQIIGMRNRLVHGYDQVDLDVLWDTVQVDLPPLVDALQKALPAPE